MNKMQKYCPFSVCVCVREKESERERERERGGEGEGERELALIFPQERDFSLFDARLCHPWLAEKITGSDEVQGLKTASCSGTEGGQRLRGTHQIRQISIHARRPTDGWQTRFAVVAHSKQMGPVSELQEWCVQRQSTLNVSRKQLIIIWIGLRRVLYALHVSAWVLSWFFCFLPKTCTGGR